MKLCSPELIVSSLTDKKSDLPEKIVSSTLEGDCWNTAVSGWEQATLIKNKINLIVNKRFCFYNLL